MQIIDRLNALSAKIDSLIIQAIANRRSRNGHFELMRSKTACIFSRSLRDLSHYSERRSGRGQSPYASYSAVKDALRIDLPPTKNELVPYGLQYRWLVTNWVPGQIVVVQVEQMITREMREICPTPGLNGRSSPLFKFTNVTVSPNDNVFVELRTHFNSEPNLTTVDFRHYDGRSLRSGNAEGRLDRDTFSSDLLNPAFTGMGKGAFDLHPGPDSSMIAKQFRNHPEQFKLLDDTWVRVTYEIERTEFGSRVRIWLADENNGPSLVVASPTNREIGFGSTVAEPPTGFYVELDTSQETEYASPVPERPCYFRNLLVFRNVRGEQVLGGRPIS